MILYFSGTGNSRYIAKRIAKKLKEEIVDINERIKNKDYSSIDTGCNVILVTPTYAWRIPKVVLEFLLKIELINAKRIWFVMSCGSEIGNASKYNQKLAKEKKLEYMGTMQIIMPENYIAMFNAPTIEKAKDIVESAEPHIDEVTKKLKQEQPFDKPRNNLYDKFMSGPVNSIFYHLCVKASPFKVKSNCVGCGLCVKKCPLNNIKLKDNKPIWGKDCTHCMACICYCPVEAIEYGKKSVNKSRYNFEKISSVEKKQRL